MFPSCVYDQKCPFSHERIWNILFPAEARVYIKKLHPSTLPGVPEGRRTDFFPHIRVYTEKLLLQIHFFAISGVLTHNYSVYTLLRRTNSAKRGKPAKQQGTAEQFFHIYPAESDVDQNMPTCAGCLQQTATIHPWEIPAGFGQLPSAGSCMDKQA